VLAAAAGAAAEAGSASATDEVVPAPVPVSGVAVLEMKVVRGEVATLQVLH
jgi:hypothetical protein